MNFNNKNHRTYFTYNHDFNVLVLFSNQNQLETNVVFIWLKYGFAVSNNSVSRRFLSKQIPLFKEHI